MNPDQEFAESVCEIITAFLSGIETIKSLEKYYRNNISAIHTIEDTDPELHKKLINKFKEQRHEINTHSIRQDNFNKTAGREGPTTASEENKRAREKRIGEYRASHPSARFWKR